MNDKCVVLNAKKMNFDRKLIDEEVPLQYSKPFRCLKLK